MKNGKKIFIGVSLLILAVVAVFQQALVVLAAPERYIEDSRIFHSGEEITTDVVETATGDYHYVDGVAVPNVALYPYYSKVRLEVNGTFYKEVALTAEEPSYVLPYIDGKTVEWVAMNSENYTYVKIYSGTSCDSYYSSSYYSSSYYCSDQYAEVNRTITLRGTVVRDPQINIVCDKNKFAQEDKAECAAYFYYDGEYDNLNTVKAVLKSDEFDISDVKASKNYKLDGQSGNTYDLSRVKSGAPKTGATYDQTTQIDGLDYDLLMTFTATIADKTAEELYITTDGSTFNAYNPVTGANEDSTLAPKTLKFNVEFEQVPIKAEVKGEEVNPPTGLANYTYLIIPAVVLVGAYILVKQKGLFKNN